MAIKTELNTLLSQKMDRKDFLRNVGIGLVAITGLTTLLRTLAPTTVQQQERSSMGYGSSAYGGVKND